MTTTATAPTPSHSDAPTGTSPTHTPALRNVRSDLGDHTAAKFVEALDIVRAADDDVDKLGGATAIYVQILNAVPEQKLRSAGYAEVLLAYGKVLLAFTRKSGLEGAILGGDVEAAALKSQLIDALRSKAPPSQSASAATVRTNGDASNTEPPTENGDDDDDDDDDDGVGNKAEADVKDSAADTKDSPPDSAEPNTERTPAAQAPPDVRTDQSGNTAMPPHSDSVTPAESKSEIQPALSNSTEDKPTANTRVSAANGTAEEPTEAVDGEDDEEDDVDNAALTWEQLEYARTTFEALGAEHRPRLAEVFETLGDLLLETDQSEGAAAEYLKAVEIVQEQHQPSLRVISGLQYNRYLALRRDAPPVALDAFEAACRAFGAFVKVDGAQDCVQTLADMRDELASFRATVADSHPPADPAPNADTVADTVTVVQPRRKGSLQHVDGSAGCSPLDSNSVVNDKVTVVQPRRRARKVVEEADDESADGEPVAKKARIDKTVAAGEGGEGKEGGCEKEESEAKSGKTEGQTETKETVETA